jgi:hypothetical protein
MCAVLAAAWLREHEAALTARGVADCLKSIAEEDRIPQERECRP